MCYYGAPYSVLDGFTLSPLPYPVLLVLAVICLFLGISWHSSYQDAVESAEESINWLLLAVPISIVFAVRWLESSGRCFELSASHRPRQANSQGGVSPWGVAALIILLLVLIHYQSIFLDTWFG